MTVIAQYMTHTLKAVAFSVIEAFNYYNLI